MQTSQIDNLDTNVFNKDASTVIDSTKQDLITAVEQGSEAADEDNDKSDETVSLEKHSKKIEKTEESQESASTMAEEDLNVPKWPKYGDPTTSQDEI